MNAKPYKLRMMFLISLNTHDFWLYVEEGVFSEHYLSVMLYLIWSFVEPPGNMRAYGPMYKDMWFL